MAVYRRSNRARSVLLVLVLLAITLITLDARGGGNHTLDGARNAVRDAFAPVQRATHGALAPVGNFFTGALHYGSLQQENQRLRQQIAAMSTANIQSAAEQRQAQQVLANEHLPFVGSIPTVAARVIDQGSSNFETTVTLNKGSRDGLAAGQPVVTAGGLVGSIGQVSAHTASVLLLTDPTFVVGVQLDPRNTGAAQGVGAGNPMRVTVVTTKQVPPTVTKGQPVVTSGLNLEKFPANIPVGRVERVSSPAGASEPLIDIAPLVDPATLSYVQVELWSPQSAP